MKEKNFEFVYPLTRTNPVAIEDVTVKACAYLDNGRVVKANVFDIIYKGISILHIAGIISPDLIEECQNASQENARDTFDVEVKRQTREDQLLEELRLP